MTTQSQNELVVVCCIHFKPVALWIPIEIVYVFHIYKLVSFSVNEFYFPCHTSYKLVATWNHNWTSTEICFFFLCIDTWTQSVKKIFLPDSCPIFSVLKSLIRINSRILLSQSFELLTTVLFFFCAFANKLKKIPQGKSCALLMVLCMEKVPWFIITRAGKTVCLQASQSMSNHF